MAWTPSVIQGGDEVERFGAPIPISQWGTFADGTFVHLDAGEVSAIDGNGDLVLNPGSLCELIIPEDLREGVIGFNFIFTISSDAVPDVNDYLYFTLKKVAGGDDLSSWGGAFGRYDSAGVRVYGTPAAINSAPPSSTISPEIAGGSTLGVMCHIEPQASYFKYGYQMSNEDTALYRTFTEVTLGAEWNANQVAPSPQSILFYYTGLNSPVADSFYKITHLSLIYGGHLFYGS